MTGPSSQNGTILRFGVFELDAASGGLLKNGTRVRLQDQPARVLLHLLDHRGETVTREELHRALWPDDTFVDFDHGLNTAVNKIRDALGDSASSPRFVETVPRKGYRFIAPVEEVRTEPPAKRSLDSVPASAGGLPGVPASPAPWRQTRVALLIGALTLAVTAGVVLRLPQNHATLTAVSPVPLTTFPGREIHPALSPDGSHVAFSWDGEKQDNFDIYVLPLSRGAPLRLTTNPADDLGPAWSPDGRKIAFIRRLDTTGRGELLVVSAGGGPEHRIRDIQNQELRLSPGRLVSPAWSPDGAWIAISHRQPEDLSEGIHLVSLTGETRKLTSPSEFPGDEVPAFSPDGRNLAFGRMAGFSTSEIYMLPLDSKFQPVGNPRRLTNDKRWSTHPEWTPDGGGIIYVSSWRSTGLPNLTYLDISTPRAVPQTIPLIDQAREISLGRHLVYTRHISDMNIWRAKIPRAGEPPARPERLIFSTWNDRAPAYSPDGKRIAFNSTRSGTPEIWISDSDGSRPVQLTSLGGTFLGTMSWSPDGQRIVFHARPEGKANLFVISAAGGIPKRLTSGSDDTLPIYSRDGRWIYFGSSRAGIQQNWRMPAEGGEAKQITTKEGIMPLESPDGKTIFFLLRHGGEIWSVPAQGGQETRVVAGVHHYQTGYAVTADGIYYQAPPHSGTLRFIRHLSFSTGRDKPIALASYPFDLGMSVSPDSRYVIFDQYDESGSDLMLVENFQPPRP